MRKQEHSLNPYRVLSLLTVNQLVWRKFQTFILSLVLRIWFFFCEFFFVLAFRCSRGEEKD